MSWPYRLDGGSDAQKHERRLLIDRYGIYSQLSALIPILGYQLYRLALWVNSERQRTKVTYSAVPSSPDRKRAKTSIVGKLRAQWRSFVWWLGGEVFTGWGLRGHWIASGLWTAWLLFLSVHRTGDGKSKKSHFHNLTVFRSPRNLPAPEFITVHYLTI